MEPLETFGLTNPQKSIWYMEQFYKGTTINNICGSLTINEKVDFKKFEQAIKTFVLLNKGFSIKLKMDEDIPKQYFSNLTDFEIDLVDIHTKEQIQDLETEMVNTPFPVIDSLLFKFIIFRLPNGHGGFVVNCHHLISDACTFALIGNVIAKIYYNLINNIDEQYDFPSYLDYINSEKTYLSSEKFKKDEEYWNSKFLSVPDIASIPSSFRETSHYTSNSKRENFMLPKNIVNKINVFCTKEKISIFNFFMAIYSIYISRVSNLDEIIIGTPILNRTNFKEKNTCGMFISNVPLKICVDNNLSFANFVSNIAKDSLSMLRHQKYPYQYLLENLREKNAVVPNLYDTMLSYQVTKANDGSVDLPYDVHWTGANHISCGINIHLHDNNDSGDLIIAYDYLIDKYSIDDIISTHDRILTIINQVLESANILLEQIEIVTPKEKNTLLKDFNNRLLNYPKDKTIIELFEEQVKKYPDNVAIVSNNEKLTYKELNEKANQLANLLIEKNISLGNLVAVYLEKDINYIISILAVLKTGAAFIPVSTSYPIERISYMLENSKSNLLITTDDLYKKLDINIDFIDILANEYNSYSDKNIDKNYTSNNLAYVLYTSGSTGLPKGVMINNYSVVNHVFAINKNFDNDIKSNDVALSIANISFDANIQEIFIPLLLGASLHLLKNDAIYDVVELVNYISNNKITFSFIPPSILEDVYNLLKNKPNCLNKLLVGVESIHSQTLNNYLSMNPNFKIHNGYGPTEATICCISYMYEKTEENCIVPIGKPFFNTKALILHPKTKQLQPVGIPGELFILGDCLSTGYIYNEDLTKNSFGNDLTYTNDSYYRTGDFAYYLPDGNIMFIGRIDSQIKLNGHRIELNEINSNILSFGSIIKCVTILKKKQLISFITSDKDINLSELKENLSAKLPRYMLPNQIVQLSSIPTTSNGKIDYKKLENISFVTNENIKKPSNETETKLYEIVKKMLDIKDYSITDSFFDLGMDSLMTIKLSIQIHDLFNTNIPVSEIFSNPTIQSLSKIILDKSHDKNTLIPVTPLSDIYPASSAQKRIFSSSYISNKNSVTYNMPGGIILEKIPDIEKLEKCFNTIIEKHEAFRTYFDLVDGNVVQKILDKLDFKLNVSSGNYKDLDNIFKSFVKPFDLNTAPLFRAELVKFQNDKSLLLFDMHHIISDGTSLEIFINDLCSLYNDNTISEPELTYKDFAVWENDNLKNNNFDDSKNYWINKFNDEMPILNLPTNYTRPAEKSFKGSKIYKYVDTDLTQKIYSLANKSGATPYMILLSSYYILLSKYSAQDDIIVGSPIIGRDNSQLLNIIGMFVNTLPLRAKINQEDSFSDFLQNIKNICLEGFEHQSYPVDTLVNDLQIPRDTSRNPLFDVLFTYQNNGLKCVSLGDIKSTYYIPDAKISKFDLSLEIVPDKEMLNLNFEYCTKLFNEDFIENLSDHYINILKFITENENAKICDIDMLFNEEKNRILYDFNNSDLDYPKDKNLVDLFNNIVSKYPDNIAVQIGEKHITYKELDEKSNTLALKMLENGVEKGDIIGVCMNKSIETIISIWAILKNSCTYMPMYIGYPKDRLEYMIENSNCKMIIANSTIKDAINIKCKVLDIMGFEKIKNTRNFNLPFNIVPTDLAYIIYTSGSTGKPKGVKITHKNLINYIFSFNELFENISTKDKFLSSTNVSFDVSIWELFLSILNGATLVLYSEEIINNVLEYSRQIIDYGITTLYIPPNILEEIYTLLKNHQDIKINKLLVGVEPIKKSTLNKYYDLNPDLKIVNGYGPTETTICSTALQYKKCDDSDDIVSIGKPLKNTQIYIVDKNMSPVPIDVTGELCISGDGVGDGYINNTAETNKNFVKNPFNNNSKLYKTGDLAKWNSNGTITYVSRKDSQIKFSGYRIELSEIDHTIMQYPEILKCLTTVYTHGKKSNLVTYFTSQKDINKDDLSSYLQTKLAFYMVPTIYIQLDNFPLTVNGKIDKKQLPVPEIKTKTEYVAPETELEKTICKIWQELFALKKIGIDDNFFDLGGDSLSAIRFQVEALNQNLNISYSDIFQFPTIRLLAQKADNSLPVVEENKEDYDYTNINKLLQYNDISNIPKKVKLNKIGNLLITGATGFLGAHILDNYLSTTPKGIAYCFVRRKDLGDPEERLRKTLEFYFDKKYTKMFGKRIKVITADITLDNFGLNSSDYEDLSNKIDIVINSAALVKHYGDYEQFNSINVLGTQKLIDFCKKYNKKLYHISTTSVSGMGIPENSMVKADSITYFSEKDLYRNQNLNNTYIKTKFEAEKLIFENINSGLDACILRMGNISSRYSDAKFQINVSENAFVNRIKSVLKLQVLQDGFLHHSTEFAPVDLCADAIITIIKSNPKFTVFHIFNNKLISFKDLVQYINEIGMKLDFVSEKDFATQINKFLSDSNLKNDVSGIIADLNKNKTFDLNANILLDTDFSNYYLQKLHFKWKKINKHYIYKYINYFKNINYFN